MLEEEENDKGVEGEEEMWVVATVGGWLGEEGVGVVTSSSNWSTRSVKPVLKFEASVDGDDGGDSWSAWSGDSAEDGTGLGEESMEVEGEAEGDEGEEGIEGGRLGSESGSGETLSSTAVTAATATTAANDCAP